ncbi:MAG: alpha/beta hydrolase, partial [Rhodococcus sp. (in: high G+C Gram-positive bacteria)]
SGPTDRNGNQAGGINPNTLGYIADTLGERGIATLRFDKFGSGRTGTAGLDPANPPGFVEQVDAAAAALNILGERTGIAAGDLAVLGHSEGSLTALSLKQRGAEFDKIGLLAPAAVRYLDLLSLQVGASIDRGVASGQVAPDVADADRERLAQTIDAIRAGIPLPYPEDPMLTSLGFVPVNVRFLAEIDSVDAPSIASSLPAETDVLITCSEKDLNVSCDQIDALRDAAAATDLQYAQFATASHTLGELGPVPATGLDVYVPLPMSVEFRAALDEWTAAAFG